MALGEVIGDFGAQSDEASKTAKRINSLLVELVTIEKDYKDILEYLPNGLENERNVHVCLEKFKSEIKSKYDEIRTELTRCTMPTQSFHANIHLKAQVYYQFDQFLSDPNYAGIYHTVIQTLNELSFKTYTDACQLISSEEKKLKPAEIKDKFETLKNVLNAQQVVGSLKKKLSSRVVELCELALKYADHLELDDDIRKTLETIAEMYENVQRVLVDLADFINENDTLKCFEGSLRKKIEEKIARFLGEIKDLFTKLNSEAEAKTSLIASPKVGSSLRTLNISEDKLTQISSLKNDKKSLIEVRINAFSKGTSIETFCFNNSPKFVYDKLKKFTDITELVDYFAKQVTAKYTRKIEEIEKKTPFLIEVFNDDLNSLRASLPSHVPDEMVLTLTSEIEQCKRRVNNSKLKSFRVQDITNMVEHVSSSELKKFFLDNNSTICAELKQNLEKNNVEDFFKNFKVLCELIKTAKEINLNYDTIQESFSNYRNYVRGLFDSSFDDVKRSLANMSQNVAATDQSQLAKSHAIVLKIIEIDENVSLNTNIFVSSQTRNRYSKFDYFTLVNDYKANFMNELDSGGFDGEKIKALYDICELLHGDNTQSHKELKSRLDVKVESILKHLRVGNFLFLTYEKSSAVCSRRFFKEYLDYFKGINADIEQICQLDKHMSQVFPEKKIPEVKSKWSAALTGRLKHCFDYMVLDVENILERNSRSELDYNHFYHAYNTILAFNSQVKSKYLVEELNKFQSSDFVKFELLNKILKKADQFAAKALASDMELTNVSASLIEMKNLAIHFNMFQRDVDEKLDNTISQLIKQHGLGQTLNVLHINLKEDPVGNIIIVNHSAFEMIQRSLFNTDTHQQDIEYVLSSMSEDKRNTDINIERLRADFKRYCRVPKFGITM